MGIAVNFGQAGTFLPNLLATLDSENGSIGRSFFPPGGVSGFALMHQDVEGYGHYLGMTLTMFAQRTSYNAMIIEYVDGDVWGDKYPPSPTSGGILLTNDAGTLILTTSAGVALTP
jgi:hypothetical protein